MLSLRNDIFMNAEFRILLFVFIQESNIFSYSAFSVRVSVPLTLFMVCSCYFEGIWYQSCITLWDSYETTLEILSFFCYVTCNSWLSLASQISRDSLSWIPWISSLFPHCYMVVKLSLRTSLIFPYIFMNLVIITFGI